MSANNTIVIARFPVSDEMEFRVAEMGNAENVLDDDTERGDYARAYEFMNAPVFTDMRDAIVCANNLEREIGYVEYGVCVKYFERPLLNKTMAEVEAYFKNEQNNCETWEK